MLVEKFSSSLLLLLFISQFITTTIRLITFNALAVNSTNNNSNINNDNSNNVEEEDEDEDHSLVCKIGTTICLDPEKLAKS